MTVRLSRAAVLRAALACALLPGAACAQSVETARPGLHWLDATAFAPERILPPPPPRGSMEERAELGAVQALGAGATAERRAAAAWDGAHEEPSAFAAAAGRDLPHLPATMRLLSMVQDEVEILADTAKRHFGRARPYTVDPAIPRCATGKNSPRSYPSGHAAFGWSTATVLAALLPDRAEALQARAADYGMSREICAAHFASDVEAGHVLGVIAARALLADPRLAPAIAAARAELSAKP